MLTRQRPTADGIIPHVGMTVYVWDSWDFIMEEHVVAKVYLSKVLYSDPLPDGYIGARLNCVYACKDKAWEAANGQTED